MSLALITPPALEPVTITELKMRLKLGHDDHDAILPGLIAAAREQVEREAGLACLTQSWEETRDSWAGGGRLRAFATQFRLLKPPLQAVISVTTRRADGEGQIWDPADYRVDTQSWPGRIHLSAGAVFPEPGLVGGGLSLRFVCGYGDEPEAVPASLRQAILLAAMHLYRQGEGAADSNANALPEVVRPLIAPWRRLSL